MPGATPERLRLDGYVRVSQIRGREGDSFISPVVQRERIAAWCAAYGHELLEVHEELDESGKRGHRRALLERSIERIERGETQGLVTFKADRFGRSLIDGLMNIERVRASGGVFVAVADGLDTSTDTGMLVLRIMLSIAEHELDRIRGNWNEAKARAVMRGIHPSAFPPFGYRREGAPKRDGGGRTGPLVPDPLTGPLVTELFLRRAGGAGFSALARWLEEEGAKTGWGRSEWSLRAVKDIVRNEAYLGVAYVVAQDPRGKDVRNPNAHPPLTDHLTWRRAQRPGVRIQPTGEASLIRGLLRCGGCRYKVRGERRHLKSGDVWLYTCRAHKRGDLAARCEHPVSLRDAGEVEAWIVERFFAGWPELRADLAKRTPALDAEREAVAVARHAFEGWRDDTRVQERLGMDVYLDGLATRQETLNAALADLARAEARIQAPSLPEISSAELRAMWPDLSRDEQHEWLSSAIQCVFARTGSRGAPLDDRLRLVWHGQPVELPARGDRDFTPTPFPFGD